MNKEEIDKKIRKLQYRGILPGILLSLIGCVFFDMPLWTMPLVIVGVAYYGWLIATMVIFSCFALYWLIERWWNETHK